ncbi:hypothetical protein JCM10295v2_002179 [Rhodotorula toruloides]
MGAQGSKPDVEQTAPGDTSFFSNRDQPIQFSESLINHLSSQSLPSSSVPSTRQAALDQHIQQRIASELQHLRQQEQQVRDEIERALEKENLDRERGAVEGEAGKGLSHSATLMKDLESLLERSAGLRKQRGETDEWRAVDDGKKALHKCFLENTKSPLNCRDEAERFKQAVASVEKAFFATVSAN